MTTENLNSNSSTPTMPKDSASSSRRSFLKGAGIATGALALGVPAVHAAGKQSPIRVGLIGCGGRGTGAAVNALQADPNVQIVALADLFGNRIARCRESLAQEFSERLLVTDESCFEGFESYQELLATDVDVVLLASPPHYRPDHIEAAVAAGKEIFCEKPVAVDATGVRRVEAACKIAAEKGLNVVSGLCWRYDQGMQETVARIHDGQIGRIVSTQSNYLTNPLWSRIPREGESDMEFQCRNWYNHTWLSGDHIVEQFVHSLDKALWLHHDEPPVKAYGLGGRLMRTEPMHGDIYDHFSVVYEWADGSRTNAHTRQMSDCYNKTEDYIDGTTGAAKLIRHEITGDNPWKFKGKEVQMHQAEQNEFFKAIRGQRDRIDNSAYMCRSTLMAILGREVCYSGKVLTYDEVANGAQDLRPKAYQWGEGMPVVVAKPGSYLHPTA